jgi:hypothetical protein
VDHKILSKTLCNRLKIIAEEIIGPEQTCGIKGRTIFDNLHFLRNVHDYCQYRQIPCCVISFDQAKAFDRVDHGYLFAVLKHVGFGPSFTRWVKLLYTNTVSQVIINGFLTEAFSLYCGARQGCGLSPLLYPLCIQPLAANINSCLLFRNVPMPTTDLTCNRIRMYADDTTVFAGNVGSIKIAFAHFEKFCIASGAELNKDKTTACIFYGANHPEGWPEG